MPTICIVGAGDLGGATAHALARGERVRRVLLIDESGTIAAGKALDIQQAEAVEGFHTRVEGTNDLTRVTARLEGHVIGRGHCLVLPHEHEAGGLPGLEPVEELAGTPPEA